jgi:hypothetical protein
MSATSLRFIVTENQRTPEPVCPDPFITGLEDETEGPARRARAEQFTRPRQPEVCAEPTRSRTSGRPESTPIAALGSHRSRGRLRADTMPRAALGAWSPAPEGAGASCSGGAA